MSAKKWRTGRRSAAATFKAVAVTAVTAHVDLFCDSNDGCLETIQGVTAVTAVTAGISEVSRGTALVCDGCDGI